MMRLKARFDGEQIIVPVELRGRPPMDLTIVVVDPPAPPTESFWEFVGKSPHPRTEEEIRQELRDLRKDWDDDDDVGR